ncbi:MAG: hypothetical protein WBQ25_14385 [Nitrososphaeraceae archaeon]
MKIATSQVSIIINLDTTRRRAIATLDVDNKSRKYEYKILNYISELVAFKPKGYDYPLNGMRLVEVPICELVTDIGRGSVESQTIITGLLARDARFMTILDDIHLCFDKCYNLLTDLRMKSW